MHSASLVQAVPLFEPCAQRAGDTVPVGLPPGTPVVKVSSAPVTELTQQSQPARVVLVVVTTVVVVVVVPPMLVLVVVAPATLVLVDVALPMLVSVVPVVVVVDVVVVVGTGAGHASPAAFFTFHVRASFLPTDPPAEPPNMTQ